MTAARFIGQRLPRREDARLLTGRGSFIDDVIVPGMLHAAFVRSPIARGRIRSIDLSAARDAPGVRAIYTGQDLQRAKLNLTSGQPVPMPPPRPVPPLAFDRVAYVGDPVAIVIADDRYLAEDAAALVVVHCEEETPVVTLADARSGPPVHPDFPDNVAGKMEVPGAPDLEAALAAAPHLVTGVIRHQRIAHCAMETRGVVAWKSGENELTVHIPSQGPQKLGRFLSDILARPEMSVRVISKDVGGSFGQKSRPWREETAVIGAALLLGRPIKWIEDRFENLTTANQAREQECVVRIGFDEEGKLLAAHAESALNNGAYPHYPDGNAPAMMFMWGPYRQPRYGFRAQGLYTNTVGLAAYRGPWAMESLARETMLDIAARQMGVDPIELRRKNLITAADLPHTTNVGMVLEDVTPAECLDKLLGYLDVPAFRAEQAAARAEGRYLGLGVAAYVEPTAMSSFPPYATEVAHVRIAPTGRITATLGTHSQGQGTPTTMAQVVAEALGARFEEITVVEDDSHASGYGAGSGGSRQAVAGGGAALKAAELLRDKIKRLAAHLLNSSPEAVSVEDGMVRVEGAPEMTRSLRQIAEVAYGEPARLPPGMEPGLEVQYRYPSPSVTFSSAAHACIVEVDVDTGLVRIRRWVSSEDCGVVINPAIVEGQIAGGLAQAIGSVLLEEMAFDARGNSQAATFKDYLLPSIHDLPDIEFVHLATPSKSIGGFRGVGEGGAIIGPPTLINAIHDALAPFGVTCLDLPLSPSKLVKLIEDARRN
jgi:carbon-monoxide dehydrogenase large subunit